MNDFKLGQDWVTRNTQDDLPDISVIGPPPALPTVEEAYRAQYIAYMVKHGIDAKFAADNYDAGEPWQYDDCTPEEAAQSEMDCWDAQDDGMCV